MSLKLNLDDASETSPPLSRLGKTLQESGAVLSDYAQQGTHMQTLRRQKAELCSEVAALSEENASLQQELELIPELERELLHHADRADRADDRASSLEEKVRSLEVLAHARCRSKEHMCAARILRSLSKHRRDMLCRNAVFQWRLVAAVVSR